MNQKAPKLVLHRLGEPPTGSGGSQSSTLHIGRTIVFTLRNPFNMGDLTMAGGVTHVTHYHQARKLTLLTDMDFSIQIHTNGHVHFLIKKGESHISVVYGVFPQLNNRGWFNEIAGCLQRGAPDNYLFVNRWS